MITELSKIILGIQRYIYNIEKDELEKSIDNIEDFARKFKTKNNDIMVCFDNKSNETQIELSSYRVPFDMIDDFQNYVNQTSKK